MENKESLSLLEKIQSKYIFESIFNYIEDENYKLKLFVYSKSFKKKLSIGLINYQEQYICKFSFEPKEYLVYNYEPHKLVGFFSRYVYVKYNKDTLKNKL